MQSIFSCAPWASTCPLCYMEETSAILESSYTQIEERIKVDFSFLQRLLLLDFLKISVLYENSFRFTRKL